MKSIILDHPHDHTVFTLCHDCCTWGVNMPDETRDLYAKPTCGNCGSRETTVYRPPCCFRHIATVRVGQDPNKPPFWDDDAS